MKAADSARDDKAASQCEIYSNSCFCRSRRWRKCVCHGLAKSTSRSPNSHSEVKSMAKHFFPSFSTWANKQISATAKPLIAEGISEVSRLLPTLLISLHSWFSSRDDCATSHEKIAFSVSLLLVRLFQLCRLSCKRIYDGWWAISEKQQQVVKLFT